MERKGDTAIPKSGNIDHVEQRPQVRLTFDQEQELKGFHQLDCEITKNWLRCVFIALRVLEMTPGVEMPPLWNAIWQRSNTLSGSYDDANSLVLEVAVRCGTEAGRDVAVLLGAYLLQMRKGSAVRALTAALGQHKQPSSYLKAAFSALPKLILQRLDSFSDSFRYIHWFMNDCKLPVESRFKDDPFLRSSIANSFPVTPAWDSCPTGPVRAVYEAAAASGAPLLTEEPSLVVAVTMGIAGKKEKPSESVFWMLIDSLTSEQARLPVPLPLEQLGKGQHSVASLCASRADGPLSYQVVAAYPSNVSIDPSTRTVELYPLCFKKRSDKTEPKVTLTLPKAVFDNVRILEGQGKQSELVLLQHIEKFGTVRLVSRNNVPSDNKDGPRVGSDPAERDAVPVKMEMSEGAAPAGADSEVLETAASDSDASAAVSETSNAPASRKRRRASDSDVSSAEDSMVSATRPQKRAKRAAASRRSERIQALEAKSLNETEDWTCAAELAAFREYHAQKSDYSDLLKAVARARDGRVPCGPLMSTPFLDYLAYGKSTIPEAGLGLYATKDIRSGTWILLYDGDLHNHDSFMKLANTDRVFELERGKVYLDGYWYCPAVLVNHASEKTKHCNARAKKGSVGYGVRIYATRDIKAGEEILMDYGNEYFREGRKAGEPVRVIRRLLP